MFKTNLLNICIQQDEMRKTPTGNVKKISQIGPEIVNCDVDGIFVKKSYFGMLLEIGNRN